MNNLRMNCMRPLRELYYALTAVAMQRPPDVWLLRCFCPLRFGGAGLAYLPL